MKRFLAVLMLCAVVQISCSFADGDHWAKSSVDFLTEKEIFNSVFSEDENLDRKITREELFALISDVIEIDNEGITFEREFIDITDAKEEFRESIKLLANKGIVKGALQEGKYYAFPKADISRGEACTIIARALNITSSVPNGFTDSEDIHDWAKSGVSAVTRLGIVKGYEDGSFKPFNNVTVGEISKILADIINKGYLSGNKLEIYAGTGNPVLKDGELLSSSFNSPMGLAMYKNKLYIADTNNNCIRFIDDEKVTTVAGNADNLDIYNNSIGSFKDGDAKKALLDTPTFMTTARKGIIFSDSENNLIRYYSNGRVTTYSGVIFGGYLDGKRNKARFSNPTGIVADEKGNIYISDTDNNVIRKIDRSDNVTTFAGVRGSEGGYKDGKAKEAMFNRPMGLALKDKVLYVADCGNQRIRKIENGIVTTVAGIGEEEYDGTNEIIGSFNDGTTDTAGFNFPKNVVVDDNGNLYVADSGNLAIRKIDTEGNVYTIVGSLSDSDNNENALGEPVGMLIKDNKLYISDSIMNVIYVYELEEN